MSILCYETVGGGRGEGGGTHEKTLVSIVGALPPVIIWELDVLNDCAVGERKFVVFLGRVVVDCYCSASFGLGSLGLRRRRCCGRCCGSGVGRDQLHVVAGEKSFLALCIGSAPPVLHGFSEDRGFKEGEKLDVHHQPSRCW